MDYEAASHILEQTIDRVGRLLEAKPAKPKPIEKVIASGPSERKKAARGRSAVVIPGKGTEPHAEEGTHAHLFAASSHAMQCTNYPGSCPVTVRAHQAGGNAAYATAKQVRRQAGQRNRPVGDRERLSAHAADLDKLGDLHHVVARHSMGGDPDGHLSASQALAAQHLHVKREHLANPVELHSAHVRVRSHRTMHHDQIARKSVTPHTFDDHITQYAGEAEKATARKEADKQRRLAAKEAKKALAAAKTPKPKRSR